MASVIDLRSDTVTKPTQAMRQAMAMAEVGDDVFGEDPTVNALEARVASLLGKGEGLFFPSATMSNLAACMAHCHEGNMNEAVIGSEAHMALFEIGNIATVGRIFPRLVENLPDGTMDLAKLHKAIMPNDVHCTTPRVICIENTNCHLGGQVLPLKYIEQVRAIADDKIAPARGYPMTMHCDGARLWNAATAAVAKPALLDWQDVSTPLTVPAALAAYAKPFDTVSVCLSKGLGCPVGSMLVGNPTLVGRARHIRKMLGGGMRQSGVLAGAAMYALDNHLHRLQDDHANARRLADLLKREEPRITVVDPSSNMVLFRVRQTEAEKLADFAPTFVDKLAEDGLRISYEDSDTCRVVANLGVEASGYERAAETIVRCFRRVLGE